MKSIITLILLCVTYGLVAQKKVTLSGYIKDGSSGEDLFGATIYVLETKSGTVANAYGFYSITLPAGKYTVRLSFIGFKTQEKSIELNANTSLNFNMQPEVRQMEVTVFSERENANVSNNEMSVAKISSGTVKKVPAVLGEPDVVRSIQLLPGITSVAEGASGFNVRGGSGDQNLILLDEGIIYNSAHLLGFYSVINPDAIKDIKIFKGGIPSRYGGRLSSVLDIRQKEGNLKEFKGEAGIGLISGRLLAEGPIVKDKGSFMVAARRSWGDALLQLLDNNNTAYFYDVNLKTNYTLNKKNRIFLSGYFGRDKLAIGDIFSNNYGNATGTLRWNSVISPKLFLNLSGIYSNYDYSLDNLAGGAEYRWKSNILTNNLKADFSYYAGEKATIEFGADQKWYAFKPGSVSPIKGSNINPTALDNKKAQELGVYASYEYSIGKLAMNAGLRYSRFNRIGSQEINTYENDEPVIYNTALDRYEDGLVTGSRLYKNNKSIATFDNWEPRLGLTYIINEDNSIKASYNRMNQYIHLISNTTATTPLDVWAPSGPFIEPQQADQFALGYFRNLKQNSYEASIELYYKDLSNMVDYINGADLLTNNNIETELLSGDGRSYGLELYLKKNTGRLTGWLSYTLSKSERKVTGFGPQDPGINNGNYYPTNFDKRHDLSITGVYQLNDRVDLSANFIYASGIPGNFPQGRYQYEGLVVPHFETRNRHRLPANHRLDVSMTLKRKPKNGVARNGEWVFGFYNLYNRANASTIYFQESEDNPGETKAYKSFLFGITPSITYNFKF
ncbi:MAG: TonB-dependent receptor [Roseivirga sp.]|nr:TonB-dependent receptor [Roseivirga sp.]